MKKILIVEDNADLSEVYQAVFHSKSFDVRISSNWKDARMDIFEFKPDIILLDIMMPHTNWFELLEKIRKNDQKTKVIINSNLHQEDEIKKWYELWANAYFKKSDYSPIEIVEEVIKILNI